MKSLRGALFCLLVILMLQLVTHFWWWILVVPLVYGALAGSSGWDSLRSGMFGAGGLWLVAAAWQMATSGRLVAQRVAEMLTVGSPWALLAGTVLLAMLGGGLAGSAGFHVRAALRPPPERS